MPGPLSGRTALVTGGSRGVGRGIALRLAAEGAAVAVNYRRDADAAYEVVEQIAAAGGRATAYAASVSDPAAVQEMVEAITADLGPVDLLVSNAGLASRGTAIADTERSEYQRLLDVHLLGPLDLIRALLPADVAGVVAFLASQDGEYFTGQRIEVDGGGPDQSLFH